MKYATGMDTQFGAMAGPSAYTAITLLIWIPSVTCFSPFQRHTKAHERQPRRPAASGPILRIPMGYEDSILFLGLLK
jgi:hypothetical protein